MDVRRIAIQGGPGSFHHQAAKELLGNDLQIVDKSHFRDVVFSVKNEENQAGLIAIENSIAGSILPNYNLIHKHQMHIIDEIYLPISMNFMTLPDVEVQQIEKVYSHPIALLQCDNFLEKFPNIQRVEYEDTAKSAKKIKEENLKNAASIGSQVAADLYGLQVLHSNIQTNKKSFTRFVLLSKNADFQDDYNKISLLFTLPHKTGRLSNVLMQFTMHQFNLTKIQSLPILEKPWQYTFYIDLLVHDRELLEETLKVVAYLTEDLLILGKYKNGNRLYT